MGRTFIRQDAQIAESFTYDDTVVPTVAAYETNAANIEDAFSSGGGLHSEYIFVNSFWGAW